MKVWKISAFGVDHLTLEERPLPELSRGQVLVKVHAVSLTIAI